MDKMMKVVFGLIGLTGLGTFLGIRKTRKQVKVERERIDRISNSQNRMYDVMDQLGKNEEVYAKELDELQKKIDELNAKLNSRRTGGKA